MECKSCKYFYGNVGIIGGECRRYAPRPGDDNGKLSVNWPAVRDHDWCGEYQPKMKKPVKSTR